MGKRGGEAGIRRVIVVVVVELPVVSFEEAAAAVAARVKEGRTPTAPKRVVRRRVGNRIFFSVSVSAGSVVVMMHNRWVKG